MDLTVKIIPGEFSVCKVDSISYSLLSDEFCFIGKTDNELSLVCRTDKVPENTVSRDDSWKCFRIEGTLDFSLIGILADISGILAENKIGLFAISTYNTDYVLTKSENFEKALDALSKSGYDIKL